MLRIKEADDISVTDSRWGKEKNFDIDSFNQWIMEKFRFCI